jgi:hypothetical protein
MDMIKQAGAFSFLLKNKGVNGLNSPKFASSIVSIAAHFHSYEKL